VSQDRKHPTYVKVVAVLALLAVMLPGGLPIPVASAQETQLARSVVTYPSPGGRALSAHIFRTSGQSQERPASAVLLFHGGAWEYGEPAWVSWHAEQFAKRGMVAIAIEYRLIDMRAPRSSRTAIVDAVADACAAFRWVRLRARELNVDPNRIAGFGISAGGHLAAMAGTGGCGSDGRADLLVLISPAVETRSQDYYPRKMPEGADAAMLDAYSPAHRVRAGATAAPTLIVNGAQDIQTPAESARTFCALVVDRGGICRADIYAGLGHLLTADVAAQQRGQYPPNFEATAKAQSAMEAFLADHGF
jgi:acetyl esterase/lipase